MNIKSILASVALAVALTIPTVTTAVAKPVYDSHGTRVLVLSRADVRDIWNNFDKPGGFRDVINSEGGRVMGLEGMTFDSRNNEHAFTTIENRTITNTLPSNWVQLSYVPYNDFDEHPGVFAHITEKGIINIYMPYTSAF